MQPDTPTHLDGHDHRVLVWDVPVRLFHWAVVVLVVVAYVTWRLNWMDWHARAGYVLLAVVLFRILWGFCGSATARLSRLLAPPGAALRHLAHALRREPDREVGHNPAGGWMVLLFLLLLLGQSLTGIYIANDIADEGPLTEIVPASIANAISALHGIIWNVLLAAAALHLLAIVVHALAKKQNLLRPMITGWKDLPLGVPQPQMAGAVRAVILLGCCSLAVAVLSRTL